MHGALKCFAPATHDGTMSFQQQIFQSFTHKVQSDPRQMFAVSSFVVAVSGAFCAHVYVKLTQHASV